MKKKIRLWYLYDFANSFATIVLIFYYPLLLAEKGASNIWIGVSSSISTLLMLWLFPYLGNYSDRTGNRISYIRWASLGMVVTLISLSLLLSQDQQASILMLTIVSILYIVFQVCFQGTYVFYSAMLRDITSGEDNTKVSGVGLGLGQLGNALALGAIGPIIATPFLLIGVSGKSLALLLGALVFTILSLPFLIQKDSSAEKKNTVFSYFKFIKKVYGDKKVFNFLIGYSLLADAILTFQLYLTLYMNRVFNFSDQMVTYAGVIALLCAVLGGFLSAAFSRWCGSKVKALHMSVLFYAICFVLLSIVPKIPTVILITLAVSGMSYGILFSLARAVYSDISPEKEQAEYFSFFTIFEKAASVVGPLVWLVTFYLLSPLGEDIQYRGSVLFLMLVCLGGLLFLKRSTVVRDQLL